MSREPVAVGTTDQTNAVASAWSSASSGFVAGTLVHTDRGLVPIEQIRLGDQVLSKPESGLGDGAYKQVVATRSSPNQEVRLVCFYPMAEILAAKAEKRYVDQNTAFAVVVTNDQPLFVLRDGPAEIDYEDRFEWEAADCLSVCAEVTLIGDPGEVTESMVIFQTEHEGIGWASQARWDENVGWNIDLSNGVTGQRIHLTTNAEVGNPSVDFLGKEDPRHFLTTVYNIEVEDFHTYFVGEQGLWVHDSPRLGIETLRRGIMEMLRIVQKDIDAEQLLLDAARQAYAANPSDLGLRNSAIRHEKKIGSLRMEMSRIQAEWPA